MAVERSRSSPIQLTNATRKSQLSGALREVIARRRRFDSFSLLPQRGRYSPWSGGIGSSFRARRDRITIASRPREGLVFKGPAQQRERRERGARHPLSAHLHPTRLVFNSRFPSPTGSAFGANGNRSPPRTAYDPRSFPPRSVSLDGAAVSIALQTIRRARPTSMSREKRGNTKGARL